MATSNNNSNVIEAGSNVNVELDGELYIGHVVKVFKNHKARVRFDDDTEKTLGFNELTIRKPGRPALIDVLSEEDRAVEIETLLEALRSTDDQGAKKNLRAALRRLGHKGGMRQATVAE